MPVSKPASVPGLISWAFPMAASLVRDLIENPGRPCQRFREQSPMLHHLLPPFFGAVRISQLTPRGRGGFSDVKSSYARRRRKTPFPGRGGFGSESVNPHRFPPFQTGVRASEHPPERRHVEHSPGLGSASLAASLGLASLADLRGFSGQLSQRGEPRIARAARGPASGRRWSSLSWLTRRRPRASGLDRARPRGQPRCRL